ncbi:hypothetical protein V1477_006678 [Vespula maculifrons]|uniref:Uncharacterized protein n=1 Tax=Vespula maculifrons TaxID=7453 RepID=A0ABD2CJR9_VESMC
MQSRDTRFRETITKSGLGPTFTIKMLYRDSRLRETTTKSGLGPTFTVTSSVELWTSTRELRKFRGCHPYKY